MLISKQGGWGLVLEHSHATLLGKRVNYMLLNGALKTGCLGWVGLLFQRGRAFSFSWINKYICELTKACFNSKNKNINLNTDCFGYIVVKNKKHKIIY